MMQRSNIEVIPEETPNHSEFFSLNENSSIRLDKKIGEGTYANLFLGECQGKQVAIKCTKNEYNPKHRVTAQREKAIHSKIEALCHEHEGEEGVTSLIRYYGNLKNIEFSQYKILKGNMNIVVEYVNGGSLESWIFNEDREFNWSMVHQFVDDIFCGLSFLHQYNIVHGDIKPANLLLHQKDDEVIHGKICDFGFTKEVDDEIDSCGSPVYIAPEILLPLLPRSPASDIYSMAIVLFEMQARTHIYEDVDPPVNTLEDLRDRVCHRGERDTISKTCPPKVARLINWGWAQSPDVRPNAQASLMVWRSQGEEKIELKASSFSLT
jgi:serine/threonine protein kinase